MIIDKYFPQLTATQREQMAALQPLYEEWNAKINVVSRKDMDNFYEHHVLHSLAIAWVVEFESGKKVIDVGTGGGFPGIPLAILFPQTHFTLVDSVGKKTLVAADIARRLQLDNVAVHHARVEQVEGKFDYAVSRAVAPLDELYRWTRNKMRRNAALYCLKGGDLAEEIQPFGYKVSQWSIGDFFTEEWFGSKKIVCLRY